MKTRLTQVLIPLMRLHPRDLATSQRPGRLTPFHLEGLWTDANTLSAVARVLWAPAGPGQPLPQVQPKDLLNLQRPMEIFTYISVKSEEKVTTPITNIKQ
jgi:hypothetical protein